MHVTFDQLNDIFFKAWREYDQYLDPSVPCRIGATHSASALIRPDEPLPLVIANGLGVQAKRMWIQLGRPRIDGPTFTREITGLHLWSFTVLEPEKSIQSQAVPVPCAADEGIRGFQPPSEIVHIVAPKVETELPLSAGAFVRKFIKEQEVLAAYCISEVRLTVTEFQDNSLDVFLTEKPGQRNVVELLIIVQSDETPKKEGYEFWFHIDHLFVYRRHMAELGIPYHQEPDSKDCAHGMPLGNCCQLRMVKESWLDEATKAALIKEGIEVLTGEVPS